MSNHYEPQTIEAAAQNAWKEQDVFAAREDLTREKFYCLSMLPYPSGQLHMGHVRNYTLGDIISRYQHFKGKNVLQPMGWDAFGLPAENAAIKHKVAPAQWVQENIAHMKGQIQSLGFAYDWAREVTTCEPDYYRWEQWLFLKLYEKGLVYKKKSLVNWDPVDQTVLANEQVVDGRGWRSGALVERREIEQWFLKITDYADQLLDDLDLLEGWPEQVRTMQRHWIGRSEGLDIQFPVIDLDHTLEVFTTRPDTLFGVSYLAIAPEHPLAKMAAEKNADTADFITQCQQTKVAEADIATLEKRGIDTGFKAKHPLTQEPLSIWIANFVLLDYGSGAVMAVPAHDQRDFEFAQKYDLSIKPVIASPENNPHDFTQTPLTEHGPLINSGEFDGLNFQAAFNAITERLETLELGKKQLNYRLRDWGVSRQRYWGCPIPMIHCEDCGTVPVPEADLPVRLPTEVAFTDQGFKLSDHPDFSRCHCPVCGKEAKRETDTFDTFVESSWYYHRYCCNDQDQAILDDRTKYWAPVDQYIGGIEHAVMHLLYARFIHKVLRDLNLVNGDEPFSRLLSQGMVLKDGAKMSKSKGNTVDPQTLIDRYGADTVRVFITFAAPPEQSLEWSDSGVDGAYRFLKRLWHHSLSHQESFKNAASWPSLDWQQAKPEQQSLRCEMHQILQQAQYDYERMQFNTIVSACMKLLNLLTKDLDASDEFNLAFLHEGYSVLLRLLSPVAPHITHHLWQALGYGENILKASWPKVAQDALEQTSLSLVIQLNGKRRGEFHVPAEASKEEIEALAMKNKSVQSYIGEKTLRKIIVVPKKLINLVVS